MKKDNWIFAIDKKEWRFGIVLDIVQKLEYKMINSYFLCFEITFLWGR